MSLVPHNPNGQLTSCTSTILYDDVIALSGHDGPVLSARFSSDGESIASGGLDKNILLWKLPTNENDQSPNYGVLQGHKGAVTSLNWVLDSNIFSTSADNTVSFWDAETGQRLRKGIGHELTVNDSAGYSSQLCVSASDDGSLRVWDEREKNAVKTIATSYPLICCDVNRNGDTIFCSGIDPTVQAFDLKTGKLLWACEGHIDTVSGLALSTDESMLVLQSMNGTVRAISAKKNTPQGISRLGQLFDGVAPSTQQLVSRCRFSKDNVYVALGSEDANALVWSTATRRMVSRWSGHEGAVLDVDFHPTEKIFLSSSMDGKVIVRAT